MKKNVTKKYRIYLHENVNGLGMLADQGFLFDTYEEAIDWMNQKIDTN